MRWLRDWSPRRLVVVWIVYWIALAIVGLGPAVPALWRATHAGQEHGSFSLSYGSGEFTLSAAVGGNQIWSGSVSGLALALWIGVPPLLLWLAWLTQRSSRRESRAGAR